MSRENVEIVRRIFESVGGGEIRYPAEFLDPDVEWVNPPYAVEPGIRRGRPAFEQAAASISGAFDKFSFEVDEVTDAGDERVLVLTTFVVQGRERDGTTPAPGLHLHASQRQGHPLRMVHSHAEALEAVGLRA